MGAVRDRLIALSWYVHPDGLDRSNFILAGVKRLYLPLDLAASELDRPGTEDNPNMLDWLAARGYEVIIRLDQHNYYGRAAQEAACANLARVAGRVHVGRCVCGVEPENAWRMEYAYRDKDTGEVKYPDWGNWNSTERPPNPVYFHQYQTAEFLAMYRRAIVGIPIFSPAHTSRHPNPSAPPWPGSAMWNRICYLTYEGFDGRVIHGYTDNHDGPVDIDRLETGVQIECSMWGPPPFMIGELGINNGPELRRVEGYIALCEKLLVPWMQEPGFLGWMIDTVVPFTSNGNPDGKWWNKEYLIKDPASYRLIRQFVDGA